MPLRLQLSDLSSYIDEEWVLGVCQRKIRELTVLSAGKAPEFVDVVNRYSNFFRLVGKSAGSARVSGGKLRDIRRALDDADQALAQLEQFLSARSGYMERIEEDRRPEPTQPAVPVFEDDTEKARKNYLDQIEQQPSAPVNNRETTPGIEEIQKHDGRHDSRRCARVHRGVGCRTGHGPGRSGLPGHRRARGHALAHAGQAAPAVGERPGTDPPGTRGRNPGSPGRPVPGSGSTIRTCTLRWSGG